MIGAVRSKYAKCARPSGGSERPNRSCASLIPRAPPAIPNVDPPGEDGSDAARIHAAATNSVMCVIDAQLFTTSGALIASGRLSSTTHAAVNTNRMRAASAAERSNRSPAPPTSMRPHAAYGIAVRAGTQFGISCSMPMMPPKRRPAMPIAIMPEANRIRSRGVIRVMHDPTRAGALPSRDVRTSPW
jgi:hypothetical protein